MASKRREGPTPPRLLYVTTAQTDLEGWVGDARIPQDGSAAWEDQAAEGPYLLSSSCWYRSRLPPKYFFCELRASTWAAQVPCFSHSCFLGEYLLRLDQV